jgi:methylmalonyl-CoA mutase
MYYEYLKHSGKYPIVGVNTFEDPDADYAEMANHLELARATDDQKNAQLQRLEAFKQRHDGTVDQAVEDLKQTALGEGNMFEQLMETVKTCSLGTITQALYEVGGKYRRNM